MTLEHNPAVIIFLFNFLQVSDCDETWTQVHVGVLTLLSPNRLQPDTMYTAIINQVL